jgi:hypothetical protein
MKIYYKGYDVMGLEKEYSITVYSNNELAFFVELFQKANLKINRLE